MKRNVNYAVAIAVLSVTLLLTLTQNCSQYQSAHPYEAKPEMIDVLPPEAMKIDDMIVDRSSVPDITREEIIAHYEGADAVAAQDTHDHQVLGKAREGVKYVGTKLWPNGTLYYRFYTAEGFTLTTAQKDEFKRACWELSLWANVRCTEVPIDTKQHHVIVAKTEDPNICGSSYLGRFVSSSMVMPSGTTFQWFKMRPDCWFNDERTVRHELLHAFGMMHEQQHELASTKLSVNWSKIEDDYEDNFIPLTDAEQDLATSFNYASIMIYNSLSFSIDGSYTMFKKGSATTDPAAIIHRNTRLSRHDHQMLIKMYGIKSAFAATGLTQEMYDGFYVGRDHVAEVSCSSRAGYWEDCFRASGKVVSYEILSQNGKCITSSTAPTHKKENQYVVVGNGCSGKFRIKYEGYMTFLSTAFRADRNF